MIYIDKYAYTSKLKTIDPVQKLIFAFAVLCSCIWLNSPAISFLVIMMMGWITVNIGATPVRAFIKFLLIPMFFLIAGALSVAIDVSSEAVGFAAALPLGTLYIGVTENGLLMAVNLFCKAMGAAACLGYLSLSTPVVDILAALKRLKMPKLLIELMGLVYRFIFVILETADTIITAQNSRLGYSNAKAGFRSFGAMSATLFIRAYKRSDDIYTALEARGYDGELNVVEQPFIKNNKVYFFTVVTIVILIIAHLFVKRCTGGLFR